MKKFWVGIFVVMSCLIGVANASAKEEGPELKFDPNTPTESQPAPKKPFVYGEEPIGKFGNENNYIKLGGYGSVRFEYGSGQDLKDTFTFRRLVFTTDARIASRFRIYTELEFERFRKIELERAVSTADGGLKIVQEIEGTNKSEIALEQAWFEFELKKWLRFKGGGVLVPLGRFNINHDDNLWNIARRPLVDRGVPVLASTSAWDELGFGLDGDIDLNEKQKLNYQIFVVNGAVLDAALEEVIATRSPKRDKIEFEGEFGISTGTFSNDIKNAKTVTGRIMYSPRLGHEFGVSGYWGRYTPDYLADKSLTSFGFDTLHVFGNFDVEAEYIFTHFGGLRTVMDSFAAAVGEGKVESVDPGLESEIVFKQSRLASTKHGYWLELRYHWRPDCFKNSWLGRHFSDPHLIPILRWEQAFINDRITDLVITNGAVTTFTTQNNRVDRLTAGVAFRLNPLAVFQLAYEFTRTNKGTPLADVVNYLATPSSSNHAVLFGTSFGF